VVSVWRVWSRRTSIAADAPVSRVWSRCRSMEMQGDAGVSRVSTLAMEMQGDAGRCRSIESRSMESLMQEYRESGASYLHVRDSLMQSSSLQHLHYLSGCYTEWALPVVHRTATAAPPVIVPELHHSSTCNVPDHTPTLTPTHTRTHTPGHRRGWNECQAPPPLQTTRSVRRHQQLAR